MLANQINGISITSEQVIKEIYGVTSNENKDKDFNQEEIAHGYQTMLLKAKKILEENKPVVLDGVFRSEEQRNKAFELAQELNIPFQIVLVSCPEEVVKERVSKRFESGIQPGGFQNHLFLESIFEPVKREHFVVDSSKDVEEQIKRLLEKIK